MPRIDLSQSHIDILPQGATIQHFVIANHNLVLSYPSAGSYLTSPYFGQTIGRVANRIRHGKVADLNGREYQLSVNEGATTHLHGGNDGWGHKEFQGPRVESRNGREANKYTYVSVDGEEGYPGAVELRVWYIAYEEVEAGITKTTLEIEYEAELVQQGSDATIINVTNHSYFNIGGAATIEGTQVVLETSTHLPVDTEKIPTGKLTPFPGIEGGKSFLLSAEEPAVDHCFVVDGDLKNVPLDTRSRQVRKMISAYHPRTSMHLEVHSTEPAFQFYTGEGVNTAPIDGTPAYGARAGFCVEPSRFPNAINVPEWRPQVILRHGEMYGSKIIYKAWKH